MRTSLLLASTAAVAATTLATAVPATANAATKATTKISFKASTTSSAMLTVTGKLTATGATVPAGLPLTLQCLPVIKGMPWYTLAPRRGVNAPVTQAGGAFTFKGTTGCAHGMFRVRFAGNAQLAPATSAPVRDTRINAMVVGWKVSPLKVRKGGYVTFSGTLKQDPKPGKYVAFKGQRVYLLIKYKGAQEWKRFARPKTDSKGRFSGRWRLYKNASFAYLYYGDKSHYYDSPQKATNVSVR
ncbi:hypothetical protein [Actinomadura logoneensis]|uniref:hypothetical protein n=1 Tax=Actinomadura logoneensis TaxID=2293572 RepID=UPI001314C274|nr:hypothetical protein [Actinomadura logoneensis]